MTEFRNLRVDAAARNLSVTHATSAAAGPGYLYFWTMTLAKGHEHVRNVCGKQLKDAGFESSSTFVSWGKFGVRGSVLALLTAVPLPNGHTYVQVMCSGPLDGDTSAAAVQLRDAVQNDRSVQFD